MKNRLTLIITLSLFIASCTSNKQVIKVARKQKQENVNYITLNKSVITNSKKDSIINALKHEEIH